MRHFPPAPARSQRGPGVCCLPQCRSQAMTVLPLDLLPVSFMKDEATYHTHTGAGRQPHHHCRPQHVADGETEHGGGSKGRALRSPKSLNVRKDIVNNGGVILDTKIRMPYSDQLVVTG